MTQLPEDLHADSEANAAAIRNHAEIVQGTITMDQLDVLAAGDDKDPRRAEILSGLGTTAADYNHYVVVTTVDEQGSQVPKGFANLKKNDFALVSPKNYDEKFLPPLDQAAEVAARQAARKAEVAATPKTDSSDYTPSAHIGKPWAQIRSLHQAIDAQRVAEGKEPYYGYKPEDK